LRELEEAHTKTCDTEKSEARLAALEELVATLQANQKGMAAEIESLSL
jgi:hypothetical protein